jgi:hypothetical protein
MMLAPNTTVLYTHEDKPEQFRHGAITLLNKLTMTTEWNTVYAAGPDSVLEAGDEILMSARPASYEFKDPLTNITVRNTADNSILAYRRGSTLGVGSQKTWLYYWEEEEKEYQTVSGIYMPAPQEPTRWAVCVAAGKLTGVNVGDRVLIARQPASTAYTLKIDGVGLDGIELHNAGEHEPIAILRQDTKDTQ